MYGITLSQARIVMTRQGERSVQDGAPTEAFWAAWRADKETLKRSGYSVSKTDHGEWKVSLWRPTSDPAARQATTEASRATDAAIDLPIPAGLELMPFQRAGVSFALRVFGDI